MPYGDPIPSNTHNHNSTFYYYSQPSVGHDTSGYMCPKCGVWVYYAYGSHYCGQQATQWITVNTTPPYDVQKEAIRGEIERLNTKVDRLIGLLEKLAEPLLNVHEEVCGCESERCECNPTIERRSGGSSAQASFELDRSAQLINFR